MKTAFYTLVFLLSSLVAHTQIIQRQTTASAGSVSTLNYGQQQLTIHSSIGQSSVIGSGNLNKMQLRQGFIQPLSAKLVRLSGQNVLAAQVFPNPFRESFQIEFTEELNARVLVTDIMGREVFRTHIQHQKSVKIDLNHLTSGTYVLRITSDGKKYIGQIIKQ